MIMKLKEGFITHDSGDEHILVSTQDSGFSGLVRSNATAAFIIEQLKTETTLEEIVSAMLGEYDVDRERALKGAETVIEQLKKIGAIEV